jgi:hypothetical protein
LFLLSGRYPEIPFKYLFLHLGWTTYTEILNANFNTIALDSVSDNVSKHLPNTFPVQNILMAWYLYIFMQMNTNPKRIDPDAKILQNTYKINRGSKPLTLVEFLVRLLKDITYVLWSLVARKISFTYAIRSLRRNLASPLFKSSAWKG